MKITTVHPATLGEEDWLRLNQLSNRYHGSEFSPMYDLAKESATSPDCFLGACVFLARLSDDPLIVGWAVLSKPRGEQSPVLHVFVDPPHRRHGIGTRLVSVAIAQAAVNGQRPAVYTNQASIRAWYRARDLTRSIK